MMCGIFWILTEKYILFGTKKYKRQGIHYTREPAIDGITSANSTFGAVDKGQ